MTDTLKGTDESIQVEVEVIATIDNQNVEATMAITVITGRMEIIVDMKEEDEIQKVTTIINIEGVLTIDTLKMRNQKKNTKNQLSLLNQKVRCCQPQ